MLLSDNTILVKQLKQSCKIADVAWACILTMTDSKAGWGIHISHGLKKSQQEGLHIFLENVKNLRWLNKIAGGKKASSRSLGEENGMLSCQRIFIFPTALKSSILIVGADRLSKIKEDLFHIIAVGVTDGIHKIESDKQPQVYQTDDETSKRAHYLMQIYEIFQQIISIHEPLKIADVSAQLIAERFGHEMVLVMLLDDSHQELVAEGVAGSSIEGVPKGFRFAKDLGIPGEVLKTGESILIFDAMDARNYYPIPGWDPGSVLCAPLINDGVVFGVINVEYQIPNLVNKADLFLLDTLASLLSSVLVNAQQYQQLQSNVGQLEAVRETALDLGKDLDLGILMKRVVNRVRDLVDARGAELGLVDEKEKLVRVLVSENPWQDYTGYSFPLMSGVAGRIAALGEPLAVADFNSWSGKAESAFKAPFTTVAGVPLKLSGEVIGTLSVQDDRPTRAFNNEDIQILELLAPQLSIFIRNARLYQELEETLVAQRLAEERLIRSAKMAAIGEMAAAIAHELNNPLTTVTGFTELILESMSEDSPEYKDLSLVLKEAQRSRTVVRRLLDFSRQGEILHVESDINEIISNVLALVHHIAQTSNTEIRVEMWDDLPQISIDRNQIQQVFLNLIHNGIQAMPHGGELRIHTLLDRREDGEWIGVVIKDSGEGISKENLDRIFEPFFTTKPSGEGTGLGLSVSYNIVSEHGGYIDVKSQEGEGAEFSVWLPVNDSAD
jgi:signal transduction histidine kinase/putative methionine-R-sulfoxide reductase with GAF domain